MNWEVGDLALCVSAVSPLRQGAVYTVREVWVGRTFASNGRYNAWDGTGLRFGFEGEYSSWDARRFIKVAPGTDVEGYEERRRELCN